MTENEYILATNKTAISLALNFLREVLADDEGAWGIKSKELQAIMRQLHGIMDEIFLEIETLEGNEDDN